MVMGVIVVLVVGTLVVRYFKSDNGKIPEDLLNGNNTSESSTTKHKVAQGENLWQIAEEYYDDGSKWVDIATENKLENASIIETDQELVIPTLETPEIEVPETENLSEASEYTVVKGDSLWTIAVRAYGDGYQWVKIASENKIAHPNLIHSGNKLVLPR